jgi:hypothetical protein
LFCGVSHGFIRWGGLEELHKRGGISPIEGVPELSITNERTTMERKDATFMLQPGTIALFNLVSRKQKRAFSGLGGNMNKLKKAR